MTAELKPKTVVVIIKSHSHCHGYSIKSNSASS